MALSRLDLQVVTSQPRYKGTACNAPCLLWGPSSAPSPEDEKRKVGIASPFFQQRLQAQQAFIYVYEAGGSGFDPGRIADLEAATTDGTMKASPSWDSSVLPLDGLAGSLGST